MTLERDVQDPLVQAAKLSGWLCYHTYDSRRSEAGFPDLTLVHAERGQLAFIECKGSRGVVSHEQRAWLEALETVAVDINPSNDRVPPDEPPAIHVGIANPDTYDSWLTFLTRGRRG